MTPRTRGNRGCHRDVRSDAAPVEGRRHPGDQRAPRVKNVQQLMDEYTDVLPVWIM